jgi:hypothetical protein
MLDEGPLVAVASRRDERFGSALLRTDLGEVYSLDLYETRDIHQSDLRTISGRGYYLPPRGSFGGVPQIAPAEGEGTAGAESLNMVQRAIETGGIDAEYGEQNLSGPLTGGLYLEWEHEVGTIVVTVSGPLRRHRRTAWTGRAHGYERWSDDDLGFYELDFVLEQYGSIEPVLYLITLLYFMLDRVRDTQGQPMDLDRCLQTAIDVCGDKDNIKSFGFSGNSSIGASVGISAGASMGASAGTGSGCQFECFERTHPQTGMR